MRSGPLPVAAGRHLRGSKIGIFTHTIPRRPKKRIGPHTLRHSFATTLMESGTDLRTIQLLMGHAHLEHTTVYLHLSQRHLHAAANPLDQITIRAHGEAPPTPKDDKA